MKPRVLYVDTLSTPTAASNVRGMTRAYDKVSFLESFDYRRLAGMFGKASMNRRLVKKAVKFRPDLIHLGKSESISGLSIKAIKEQIDTYVIHFYGDFRWRPSSWVIGLGRYVDCTLFSNAEDRILDKYQAAGVKNIGGLWIPGTDPSVFYPRDLEKTYDVIFMGSNQQMGYDGYETRRQLIEAVIDAGIDMHLYGGGWDYLRDKAHLHTFVTEGEFAKACSQAKITLGINAVNDARLYASWPRTMNSMASGAFHLTHYVPGLETIFEDRKHLVWFYSVLEALELIKYYLTHPIEREAVAKEGRQKVLAECTWDARIGEMIARIP